MWPKNLKHRSFSTLESEEHLNYLVLTALRRLCVMVVTVRFGSICWPLCTCVNYIYLLAVVDDMTGCPAGL